MRFGLIIVVASSIMLWGVIAIALFALHALRWLAVVFAITAIVQLVVAFILTSPPKGGR